MAFYPCKLNFGMTNAIVLKQAAAITVIFDISDLKIYNINFNESSF